MSLVEQLHAAHKARLARFSASSVDGRAISQLKQDLANRKDEISKLNDELRRQREIIAEQKAYIEKLAGVAATAQPKLEEILACVCKRYGLSRDEMRSQSRAGGITHYRQIYYFLGREYNHAFAAIGFQVCKDHSSVMHGVGKIRSMLESDTQFQFDIDELKKKISIKVYERQQSLEKYLSDGDEV